jgi:lipoprotein-anchoring transpeptidase ErfK/SrfK
VDKAESKLYFLGGDQVVLTLDARFGGAANPTREGSFTIYRKDANHTSTLFGSDMPYAMFFSNGEAVHYSSDFAARGYNGHSHGCVNIRDKAALAWLFDQVPVGTPVYIYS